MKRRKFWLFLTGSALSLSPLTVLAAACGTTDDKNVREQKDFVTENKMRAISFNATNTISEFLFRKSSTYGSYNREDAYISTPLLRKQSLNQPTIISTTGFTDNKTVVNRFVVEPTWNKIKLEGARAIVITLKDNSIKIYDNDNADVKSKPTKEFKDEAGETKKAYSHIEEDLISNDPRSVNSEQFKTDLFNAKKIQFVIRENVKYVNSSGEDTGFTLQAEDYYNSWLATKLLNTAYRRNNGGSEELDDLYRTKLYSKTTNYLTLNSEYSNEYLYAFYGIDSGKFDKKDEFLTVLDSKVLSELKVDENTKAVTINSVENSENVNFKDWFESSVLSDTTFLPLPTQYVESINQKAQEILTKFKEENANKELENKNLALGEFALKNGFNYIYKFDQNLAEAEILGEILSTFENINKDSFVYKTGFYWYAVSGYNTLYSGWYYPNVFNGTRVDYKLNTFHYDQEWVNAPTTLQILRENYQANGQIDRNVYATRVFQQYAAGELTSIAYSQLTEQQKQEALNSTEKFGIRYSQQFNDNQPYYLVINIPFAPVTSRGENFFAFNDAYSLINYGVKRSELAKGKSNLNTYYNGTGLSFRSIITAAINHSFIANVQSSNQQTAYLGIVALDTDFGGKNQKESQYQTPRDARLQLDSLYAFNAENQKINFGTQEQPKYTLSMEENRQNELLKATQDDKAKSVYFDKLKEELKKLIDKFDQEHPELKDQKFEFTLFWPYVNPTNNITSGAELLVQTIKSLNDRLEPKFVYVPNTTQEDKATRNDYLFLGKNLQGLVRWKYDYKTSIGSGIDGLSWSGALIPILTWFNSKKDDQTLRTNFPRLFHAAEKLMKYALTNEPNFPVPLKDLYKVDGSIWTSGVGQLQNMQFELKDDVYVVKTEEKDGRTSRVSRSDEEIKKTQDPYIFSAIFWYRYVQELTNEELIQLLNELTVAYGYETLGWEISVSRVFSETLANKNFEVPISPSTGNVFYQDWKVKA
ncbi:hypothetical protein VBM87_01185 [Mycoplasma sp. 744]|uniref:OppA family ABC transporter substrate-binding lipoprotein n=1 Tax=Mycoplasma sp. 744 TaxID=3108531 RepID=UPI002B1DBFBA|nr:hypothetical protein [Mycoplasma sp. 744]MEA4115395.1 hypothetical protein [Mycoplasma sp. 744]